MARINAKAMPTNHTDYSSYIKVVACLTNYMGSTSCHQLMRIHTLTHACALIHTHMHVHAHSHICTHTHAHACTHAHMHIHTHTHTLMHDHMRTHTHSNSHTHARTLIHTHTERKNSLIWGSPFIC